MKCPVCSKQIERTIMKASLSGDDISIRVYYNCICGKEYRVWLPVHINQDALREVK